MPEVESKEKVDNLKVESLDDLFEEEPTQKGENQNVQTLDLNDFEETEKVAPILPQGNEQEDDDLYDLQKELEAKFDELFGPLE